MSISPVMPEHIATLVSELGELAELENLGLVSQDNLRRRLKDAAKWLKLLCTPSQFRPLDQPDFVVPAAETFFDYHPERWGTPVQFSRLRELDRAWALARPPIAGVSSLHGRGFVVTWHASHDDAKAALAAIDGEAEWHAAEPEAFTTLDCARMMFGGDNV